MGNSLLSGASGLSASQQMLDVVGNNLANANTVGFKEQNIEFSDVFSQALGSGNSDQVGTGVQVASVDSNTTQGDIQSTGRQLDLALQGNGFFVAHDSNGQTLFTRAGAFGIDANNFLVDPTTGDRIQRYGSVGEATAGGIGFQATGDNDIKVPVGTSIPGKATSSITVQGNLSAAATGPEAQVLTSGQAFLTGGAPATAATLLNKIDGIGKAYAAGDSLVLQGTAADGSAVNATLSVGPATTLGNLVTALNADVPGATASIDASGNLVVKSNTTGPSNLNLTISDAAGNTGAMDWIGHGLTTTTTGKNGDTVQASVQVYDNQGTAHDITLVFQKQSAQVWNMTAQLNASEGVLKSSTVNGITFNTDGSFHNVSGGSPTISALFAGQTSPQQINLAFGANGQFSGLTQLGGGSSAAVTTQNGFGAGVLNGITIGKDGTMTGNFSNGQSLAIAQLAVANFANASALNRTGNNYYSVSGTSGPAQIGTAGTGALGSIQQGGLESSNVDISTEFTQLIVAQNGYQVNAKALTVTDQVLQDLANIIH